ncbi:MAG: hypothetical protein IPO27_00100 [Bacteroidetes bacterium]|nr:hypothetical protein [Bacteroidota bacterium]
MNALNFRTLLFDSITRYKVQSNLIHCVASSLPSPLLFLLITCCVMLCGINRLNGQTPTLGLGFAGNNYQVGDTVQFINTSTGFPSNTIYYINNGLPCGEYPDHSPVVGDTCDVAITGTQTYEKVYALPGTYYLQLRANYNGQNYIYSSQITIAGISTLGCNAPICNLVHNGGFEDIITCPLSNSPEYLAGVSFPLPSISCNWFYPTFWVS